MFESLSFLWLRRTELFILNQEFSLTFTRSDVNTCALLQNGYIAFRKLDKFLETVWILSDLEAGLSQLFLYISSLSKKRTWTPLASVSYKKTPKQKYPNKQKTKTDPRSDKTWHSQMILSFIVYFTKRQYSPFGTALTAWPKITRGHSWLEVMLVSGQYHKH